MGKNRYSIAVLILAHKNLNQIRKLVGHLQTDFDVYVHIDRKSRILVSDFTDFERTQVIKRIEATWGSLGIVLSTLDLLRVAIERGPYDRYVLISGQDVPLQSNSQIAQFFSRHKDTDFVDTNAYSQAEEARLTRVTRFHFFKRSPASTPQNILAASVSRRVDEILYRAGVRRSMRYPFRWGSQWMDLTHRSVQRILSFIEADRNFLRRFRFTFCPDEVFFQTALEIVANGDLKVEAPRRFIDWITGPEKPRVFRINDYPKIADSKMLFARKIDTEIDSELVDRLYSRLSG